MELLLCCDEQISSSTLLSPSSEDCLPFTNYAINGSNCTSISPYVAPNYDTPPINGALNLPINAPSPDYFANPSLCPFISADSRAPCTECDINGELSMPVTEAEIRELLVKQLEYMPDEHYLEGLRSHNLIQARSKSIQWMLEARTVFNFTATTIALAINYFDRYLSLNLSKVQSTWMFELLAIACLSTSIKMEETISHELTSIQVGTLEHNFDTQTITRMELLLLQTLQWKLKSVTSFSFVEIALYELKICERLRQMLLARISNLVFGALSEGSIVRFPPSVLAACGIFQVLEEFAPSLFANVMSSMSRIIYNLNGDFFYHCCKLIERTTMKEPISLSPNDDSNQSPNSISCEVIKTPIWIEDVSNLFPCNMWKLNILENGYMYITMFSRESRKRKRVC